MIPKIIHQCWEGKTEPLPENYKKLSNTWVKNHKDWCFIVWNESLMIDLVKRHFPEYLETYQSFSNSVQRWDIIRYMILYVIGGVYADLDTECFKPIDSIIEGKECFFGLEPEFNSKNLNQYYLIGNAFMGCEERNDFMLELIKESLNYRQYIDNQQFVLESTGPIMINRVYEKYSKKETVNLIPSEIVTPLNTLECVQLMLGENKKAIDEKLKSSYCVHYFFNTWIDGGKKELFNKWLDKRVFV